MVRVLLSWLILTLFASSAGATNLLDYIPDMDEPLLQSQGINADEYLAKALLGGDGVINLPRGRLRFSKTIHLKTRVRLVGEGGGLAGKPVTELIFAPNISGIVVHRSNTGPHGLDVPATTGADGSTIEGITLRGEGTSGHGIWLRAKATIRDCMISGFGEDGIHIVAGVKSADPFAIGNANLFHLSRLRIQLSGRHGVYVSGTDVNAGYGEAIDVTKNAGWGIYDGSYLGNTWIGTHAAGNKLGPYKTTNANSRTLWLGSYSEIHQPPSEFTARTIVVGGLHGAGVTGGLRVWDGQITPFSVSQKIDRVRGRKVRINQSRASAIDVLVDGDDSNGWSLGWWDEKSGTLQFRHAIRDDRVAFALTTDLSNIVDENNSPIGPGQIILGDVWSRTTGNLYRHISLIELENRIKELEQQLRALEER